MLWIASSLGYFGGDDAPLFDTEMDSALFAKGRNDETRLILSRATDRAHHFDLIFRRGRTGWFPKS